MQKMESDSFSRYHPLLNFFYFGVVLLFTMFNQHPVFLGISYAGAVFYAALLNGWRRTLRQSLLLTLPGLLVVALLNPMFNHYGVTMLYYVESSGNWITLEALVYGVVLGAVMFVVIQWFSCYNQVMTTDKFVYLFGRIIPALSLVLSMALRFVPRFLNQLGVIRNGQKAMGRDVSERRLLDRIKYGLQMLSILVTWSLENAIETSDSMKCRGYGEKGRTAFSLYRFDKRDILCLLFMGASFALTLFGFSKGYTFCQYNPKIIVKGIPLTAGSLLVYLAFLLFSVLPVVLEFWDRYQWKQRRKQVEKAEQANYRLWEVQD